MVELTSKSSYRILILHKSDLWYPRNTIRDQNTFPGAVDCSRREPKKKIQALYLGTVLINIPKVKTFVIRTHILVGDKEMHGDMTVTILKYANTPHSKCRRKCMPAG